MNNIKTWRERVEYPDHGLGIRARDAAIDAEITELRTALAERDAELTKAQDELNCTEVELEVAACNLPEDKFNQDFECMGDFARAVSEWYKAELATLQAAATQALEALIYHTAQTRPIVNTQVAIHSLQSALGEPT